MTRSVILVINSTLIWGNNLYDAWPYNATKLNLHVRSPKKANHLNIVIQCVYTTHACALKSQVLCWSMSKGPAGQSFV